MLSRWSGSQLCDEGKIFSSDLFDEIFVQPASHDAGCAIGAAITTYKQLGRPYSPSKLSHVYWGKSLPASKIQKSVLDKWDGWLNYEKIDCITSATAELLASGKVIGWVQGRSEFGPRALGNRSILADPRPHKNKIIINKMVKKREEYRPFAPSVLEEHIHDFLTFRMRVHSLL